jgi:DNA-directed RNA polymerase specialized sigma24 family protein
MGHALSEEAPAPSLQRGEQRGEQGMLERLRKSLTEQKRRTVRAAILLDSFAGLSDQAIAQVQRVNRNSVRLWITEMPPLWRAGEPTLE